MKNMDKWFNKKDLKSLKEGDIIRHIVWGNESRTKVFFDGISVLKSNSNNILKLDVIERKSGDWNDYILFLDKIETNDDFYYMGKKEEYPEYFI